MYGGKLTVLKKLHNRRANLMKNFRYIQGLQAQERFLSFFLITYDTIIVRNVYTGTADFKPIRAKKWQ